MGGDEEGDLVGFDVEGDFDGDLEGFEVDGALDGFEEEGDLDGDLDGLSVVGECEGVAVVTAWTSWAPGRTMVPTKPSRTI